MTLYDDLGLAPDAAPDDIAKAHRQLVRATHPDSPSGDRAAFERVQRAYETLKDPDRRAHYDRTGDGEMPREDLERRDEILAILNSAVGRLLASETFDPARDDLRLKIKELLAPGREQLAAQERATRQELKRTEDVRRRLKRNKRRDTKPAFLLGILDQNIESLKMGLTKILANIEMHRTMIEEMDSYLYEVDPAPPQSQGVTVDPNSHYTYHPSPRPMSEAELAWRLGLDRGNFRRPGSF
jgi:curved DNA-binding protein CbpA